MKLDFFGQKSNEIAQYIYVVSGRGSSVIKIPDVTGLMKWFPYVIIMIRSPIIHLVY
jgi:hypothetical protein